LLVDAQDLSLGVPGWALSSPRFRYFVDNESCALRASNNFLAPRLTGGAS
jgi:hypothetical protein